MRRLFWAGLGAGVAVLVVRRVGRVAQAYTPSGIAASVAAAADSLRDLADVVREGMAEREQELRIALGVDTGTIDPDRAADLLENPSAVRKSPREP